MPRPLLWQLALLVPPPLLTLLYLIAVRTGRVQPRFTPLLASGILPLLAATIGATQLRRPDPTTSRGVQMTLLVVAALEISLTVLAASVVGFAIGLRSL